MVLHQTSVFCMWLLQKDTKLETGLYVFLNVGAELLQDGEMHYSGRWSVFREVLSGFLFRSPLSSIKLLLLAGCIFPRGPDL